MEEIEMSEMSDTAQPDPPQFRLAVAGGRDRRLTPVQISLLTDFFISNPNTILIHGDCKGVDKDCAEIAAHKCIATDPHPAKWNRAGGSVDRSAGFKRNNAMLHPFQHIDLLMAFPGNNGTRHAVRVARMNHIIVVEID
jgi:hypothetical protein